MPADAVETLLTPASAPWLKVPEVIEYVREIAPRRALRTQNVRFGTC